jgi:hypothetical protein
MFNWFKEKTRPLERVKAEGLEALLNNDEAARECYCTLHCFDYTAYLMCPQCAKAQESALSSESSQDHQSRPEALEPLPIEHGLAQEQSGSFHLLCYGQGDTPHLYKGPSEAVTALVNSSIQSLKPQAIPAKQISSRRTVITPDTACEVATGQMRPLSERQRQTGSATSAGSSGKGTSAVVGLYQIAMRPLHEQWSDPNIQTGSLPNP